MSFLFDFFEFFFPRYLQKKMSADQVAPEIVEEVAPVAQEAPAQEMNIRTAVQAVLRQSLAHDGLARGLREVVAALDRGDAIFCVLAKDCDEPAYVKLVEALCAARQITLIRVPEGKLLGQWVGLCKVARDGTVCKVRRCSACVVKSVGKDSSDAVVYLNDMLKNNKTIEIEAEPEAEAADDE